MKFFKLLLIAGLVSLFACETEVAPEELEKKAEVVDENIESEYLVLRAFENVNNYGVGKKSKKGISLLNNEPLQIWQGDTLTMDFAAVPGKGGKIIAVFSDTPAYVEGLSVNVSFIAFVDGSMTVNGNLQIVVDEVEDGEKVIFSIATNEPLVFENTSTYTWDCDQTIEWYEGLVTEDNYSDDAYIINGIVGHNSAETWSDLVIIDLIFVNNCEFMKAGVVEIKVDDDTEATICNFGVDADGNESNECDGYVKISFEGISIIHNFGK